MRMTKDPWLPCFMLQFRLKCPACCTLVKVNEDLVFRQPVLRCARCHGLVDSARHRLSLLDEAQADEVEARVEFMKQSQQPQQRPLSLMVVCSMLGLGLLAGLCWVMYHLVFRP